MLEKKCDIGLLPVAALLTHPEWNVVGSTCIASDGAVQSVKLFHRRPIRDCRRIALCSESMTSNLLLKIILRERYDFLLDRVEWSSEDRDAFLLIGDHALRFQAPHWQAIDLGEEWKSLVGLPFVYALWLSQDGNPAHEFAHRCESSLFQSMETLMDWLPEEASRRDLALPPLISYFKDSLKFKLTDRCQAGLAEFWKRARAYL